MGIDLELIEESSETVKYRTPTSIPPSMIQFLDSFYKGMLTGINPELEYRTDNGEVMIVDNGNGSYRLPKLELILKAIKNYIF